MAEIKWIKIAADIFDNRKIRQIDSLPKGDMIIVIWLRLLCLAGSVNDSGSVYLTKEIPYTDRMLSKQFGKPLAAVQLALKTFEQFGMIETIDGVIKVSNWEKYQNTDKMNEIREYNRAAKQRSRAKLAKNKMSLTSQGQVGEMSLNVNTQKKKKEEDIDIESHSFILSSEGEKKSNLTCQENVDEKNLQKRKLLGGTLGGGVVILSDEQLESLCNALSVDELNKYIEIIRDCELSGKKFKKKTHYQAILDMARRDRKV